MRHDGLEDPPGSKPERKYCMCKGEPVLCPALAYFLFYFIVRLRLLLLLGAARRVELKCRVTTTSFARETSWHVCLPLTLRLPNTTGWISPRTTTEYGVHDANDQPRDCNAPISAPLPASGAGFWLRTGRAEIYRGKASTDRTSHHAQSCPLCLHHSPSSTSEEARAHPENRQVPSQTIRSHLQSSPTWCCTRFARILRSRHLPRRAASPHSHFFHSLAFSWHHVCGFPRIPESLVNFPTPTPRRPTCSSSNAAVFDIKRHPTRLHDVYTFASTKSLAAQRPIHRALTRPWVFFRIPLSVPAILPFWPFRDG